MSTANPNKLKVKDIITVVPVSYTHLDVYKRQLHIRLESYFSFES